MSYILKKTRVRKAALAAAYDDQCRNDASATTSNPLWKRPPIKTRVSREFYHWLECEVEHLIRLRVQRQHNVVGNRQTLV